LRSPYGEAQGESRPSLGDTSGDNNFL